MALLVALWFGAFANAELSSEERQEYLCAAVSGCSVQVTSSFSHLCDVDPLAAFLLLASDPALGHAYADKLLKFNRENRPGFSVLITSLDSVRTYFMSLGDGVEDDLALTMGLQMNNFDKNVLGRLKRDLTSLDSADYHIAIDDIYGLSEELSPAFRRKLEKMIVNAILKRCDHTQMCAQALSAPPPVPNDTLAAK